MSKVISRKSFLSSLGLLLIGAALPIYAKEQAKLRSPEPGVLCDLSICANRMGISRELTEKHLGKNRASRTFSQGDFDSTQFAFANGIFCDSKEQLCRTHRYYNAKGQRSGSVSKKYTKSLFGR